MRRLLTVLATSCAMLAAVSVFAASGASAAPELSARQATTVITDVRLGMTLVGFDAQVAAAHGYKIVTYKDGSRQSVPVDPTDKTKHAGPILGPGGPGAQAYSTNRASAQVPATGVIPAYPLNQDTVYGNCGASFIEAQQTAGHQIWMRSGFVLKAGEIPYSINWVVELEDANGTSYQGTTAGPQASESWSHLWEPLTQVGWSTEFVVPGSSHTVTESGNVCVAGQPEIKFYVTS